MEQRYPLRRGAGGGEVQFRSRQLSSVLLYICWFIVSIYRVEAFLDFIAKRLCSRRGIRQVTHRYLCAKRRAPAAVG